MEIKEKKSNKPVKTNLFSSNKISLSQRGRVVPQAIDLEEAVLGALMIDKKAVDEVIDMIPPEIFYNQKHQEIFKAIQGLFKRNEPIDLLTVAQELKKIEQFDYIGGDFHLTELSQKVSSSAHVEYHTRIIIQKYIQRELISICAEIEEMAYDESTDVFELLDKAEAKLFDITHGNIKKDSEKADVLIKQVVSQIEAVAAKEGISGIPSGFEDIDRITSGWQPSDLIVVAARPGMGKTAFVLSMARNMAVDKQIPVAIFSLEMSALQIISRLISSETGISLEKLKKGSLQAHEWQQLHAKIGALEKANIFIDDTPALSIFDLRAKCRRLVSQHKVELIVIDYLQLMTAGGVVKGGNREQEISTISRNLKSIAKELNIPMIALSQLSRDVEKRGGVKRPLLSDLRESGAIEQDADIVSFIYRPEYYGLSAWDDEEGTPCQGQAEFMIEKHRNGGVGRVKLRFIGSQTKFQNINDLVQSEIASKMNVDIRDDIDQVFESPF